MSLRKKLKELWVINKKRNDNMESYKYILVNGYGWSGSSALVDFFREFNNCYVPHKEFRLIKDPHGLRDLDIQLNQSIDALNEDTAIKEFLQFIKVYARIPGGFRPLGLAYSVDFGSNFEQLSESYIKRLVNYEYSGYWWYLDMDTHYIEFITHKVLNKLKIYDHKEHTKMRLTLQNEDEFLAITREYIDSIFSELLKKKKYDTVVLDQAIPANRASWGDRYFNNSKVIVVDRDPRDVYIDLIKEKSLVGYDVAVNHDVRLFIDWFKKVRKEDPVSAGYMRVQFEELIQDYDNTVQKIYEFCDIGPSQHSLKRKKLVPEVSRKNIGMWKTYNYPNEIAMIEENLKEYLVQ